MLSGVLLHMVVASLPVEDQGRGARHTRVLEEVVDCVADPLDIDDGDLIEMAVIRGLPTTLRVEQGVVENGVGPAVQLAGTEDHELGSEQLEALRGAIADTEAYRDELVGALGSLVGEFGG